MSGDPNCIICRKLLPRREKENQEWEYSCWKNQCAESLSHVLLGTAKEYPAELTYFQNGNYCPSCLQMVRDVDFCWRQMKHIARRGSQLLSLIQLNLQTNYQNIKKETSDGVPEQQIPTALTEKNETGDISDEYSYDKIRESIYSASIMLSKRSPLSLFVEYLLEDQQPVSADDIKYSKLELDDSEISDKDEDTVWCDRVYELKSYPSDGQVTRVVNEEGVLSPRYIEKTEPSSDVSSEEDYAGAYCSDESVSQSDDSSIDKRNAKSKIISQKRPAKNSFYTREKKRKKYQEVRETDLKIQRKECPICQKYIRSDNFVAHQRIHTGERPFKCPDCEWNFLTKSDLRKHSRRRHGKLYSASAEDESSLLAFEVENEFASLKRNYHCELCSSNLTHKYRYLRHLKDKHVNIDVQDGDAFHFHYCDSEECLFSVTSLFRDNLRKHISESHIADIGEDGNQKQLHVCNTCQRYFALEENLETHIKSHKEGFFGCDYCHLTFSSQTELEQHKPRHVIIFQNAYFGHLCEECGERFADIGMLNKHTKLRHKNGNTKRERRIAISNTKKERRIAISNTKKERRIAISNTKKEESISISNTNKSQLRFCNICQKNVNVTLKTHMYIHTNPDGFKCSKCFETHISPKLLKAHEKRVHPLHPFESKSKAPNYKITEQNNGPTNSLRINCSVCHRLIPEDLLNIHMESHNSNPKNPKGLHCPHCEAKLDTPKLLQRHISRHHPQDDSTLPPKFKGSQSLCDICNKKFVAKIRYRNHIIKLHPEEYQTTHPHVCKFCYCVFSAEDDRNDHVEKSHNSFPYTFEGCGKKFRTRARLNAHLNIHNNKKPFVCPHCQKRFSNDGNCFNHINMVHNKHRTILCKLCPEDIGFYIRKEFNKHVSLVHPEITVKDYPSVFQRNKPAVPIKLTYK